MGVYASLDKANSENPTVGFRCPSARVKEAIKQVAKARGQTVNEYLQSIVVPQVERDAELLDRT